MGPSAGAALCYDRRAWITTRKLIVGASYSLLFADLVDSTALVERLGDERAAVLWQAHDREARRLLARHAGREIDRSDGFFLLFERPADALRFALGYHELTAGLGLAARVGLHHGPVTLRHNPPDDVERGAKPLEVEGLAKPLAARIMMLAEGGRTLLSAAAAAIEAGELDQQVLHRHGHYRFKGVEEPVEVAEVGPASAAFTPPADGDKAYRVVRVDELWRPVRDVRHNLVPERDAFVGRRAELRHLADELGRGVRLLTVLGPGGTGKTRLARRYAAAWLGEWPGGVYFCDLSEARSIEGILFAVAVALGVPLAKGDASAQLGHAIAARGRCLLILDNFEQVAAHAPATLGAWLDRAGAAGFVVTSRERLRLPGEVVTTLDPMPLADDAIALFAVRARAHQPDFSVNANNHDAVAEIVRLLDGLPLAIELAAARVRVLAPAQIVARLKDRFMLLSGARGVAARQATLKAAIDWSWDLLLPWEQRALAQCSVFDGGFTLEAAEAVLDLSDSPDAAPVLDAIHSLVDKCLLREWQPTATRRLDIDEPFFGMLISIRDYASRKLHDCGEHAVTATEQRHGRYFAGFGSAAALDALMRHGGLAKRQTLALEIDNLVRACRRAIQRGEAALSAACFLASWPVLEAQGPFSVASALGLQVLALGGIAPDQRALVQNAVASALRSEGRTDPARAMLALSLDSARASASDHAVAAVLRELAVATHRDGRMDDARRHFEATLALCERLDPHGPDLGRAHANFANLLMELGQMPEATTHYEAALALHREVGNRAAEGIALGNLATLHHELGRADEARSAYDAALAIHREAGSLQQEAISLCNLGILLQEQDADAEAAEHYRAALKIHREIGNRRNEGVVLASIGELHMKLGDHEGARAHLESALRIHREAGNRRFEGGALGTLGELLVEQGRMEPGLQLLEQGIAVLREVGDSLYVAKLLCTQGRALVAVDRRAAAAAALDEAERIRVELGAEPGSDLGHRIDALRALLEPAG
jgi:predicted ATPase/class 3 adenylate cyclase/Tfp pilus assembly protein PilF